MLRVVPAARGRARPSRAAPLLRAVPRHGGAAGLPFVLDTATWRANPDWGAQLGLRRRRADGREPRRRRVRPRARRAGARTSINGIARPARRRLRRRGADDRRARPRSTTRGRSASLADAGVDGHGADAVLPRGGDRHRAAPRPTAGVPGGRRASPSRPTAACPTAVARARRSSRSTRRPAAADFFMINCAHPTHIAAALDGTAPG